MVFPKGRSLDRLFTVYTSPLGGIIKEHGVNLHLYADDTQMYIACHTKDIDPTISQLEDCIATIGEWMAGNRLRLNEGKTDLLVLRTKPQLRNIPPVSLQVGTDVIEQSPSCCNLGVIFDSSMSMELNVKKICRAANMQIRDIGRIRKYLSQQCAEQLVHSFITTRLDYSNCLLYGAAKPHLNHLQLIQNTAARIVTRTKRVCPVSQSSIGFQLISE